MPLLRAFQRHFIRSTPEIVLRLTETNTYKMAQMKEGLNWMTTNIGNALARFLMGTIFLVVISFLPRMCGFIKSTYERSHAITNVVKVA